MAVNCAALPEALAEGELFGYRRGAFTGADRASPGFFRSADGGTLLLDEVSDLPLALQAKLLRVLEEREVQPLGETRPVPIDVRVIVAGQQPLIEAVRAGRFRADLLARLDGLTVRLPPLRHAARGRPPAVLASARGAGPGARAGRSRATSPSGSAFTTGRSTCASWSCWSGACSCCTAASRPCARTTCPSASGGAGAAGAAAAGAPAARRRAPRPRAPAEPVELPALVVALRASGGNVARAAAMLGISRQRAYRLMEGQAIDLEALRKAAEEQPRMNARRGARTGSASWSAASTGSSACWPKGGWASSTRRSTPSCGGASR